MSEHSAIEWTEATWNPITGCTEVSPGCANCYAARLAGTRLKSSPDYVGLITLEVINNWKDDPAKGKVIGKPRWTGETRFNPDRLKDKPQENVCVVECQVRGCVCVNATVVEPEPLEVKRP